MSQIRAVPSMEAETMVGHATFNATTGPVWPTRLRIFWHLCKSHLVKEKFNTQNTNKKTTEIKNQQNEQKKTNKTKNRKIQTK